MKKLELWVLGDFDSRGMYIRLSVFGLNVLQMTTRTYVYGEIEEDNIAKIISICREYGEIQMITPKTPP